jgi:hypothetical protein
MLLFLYSHGQSESAYCDLSQAFDKFLMLYYWTSLINLDYQHLKLSVSKATCEVYLSSLVS